MSLIYMVMAAISGEVPTPPADGSLFSWGYGTTYRKLGDAATTTRSSPVQVGAVTTWRFVAVGDTHAVAVKNDNTLWTWGTSGNGQCGIGTTSSVYSLPAQVGALSDWSMVSTFWNFTVALKTDGSIWSWGLGGSGQLGHGNTTQLSSPVQIGAGYDWCCISAGSAFTAAVKFNGTLWTWGSGGQGQLGGNSLSSRSSPLQVGGDTDWFSVSAGAYHCMGIRTDGTLWAWGDNSYGQLGTGNTTSTSSPVQIGSLTDWVLVVSASANTYAIKSDGTLWGWGRNTYGQLGQGNTTNRSSPVQIGSDTDWRVIRPNFTESIYNGQGILAVKSNGTLWAVGSNGAGQLGVNTATASYSTMVQVGADVDWVNAFWGGGVLGATNGSTAFGIRNENGSPPALPDPSNSGFDLYVFGDNTYGAIGLQNLAPYPGVAKFANQKWRSITSLKNLNSYGMKSNGQPYACGVDNSGYLGAVQDSGAPQNTHILSPYTGASAIAPGMLISKGKLYCWGTNTAGEVGDSSTTTRSSPVQIGALTTWSKVSSNGITRMAIKNDGTLWAWGLNSGGQLGKGNTTNYSSPVQVGALTNWADVHVGADDANVTVMAIKTDGTLWGWGYNADGRIGDGTTTSHSSPVQVGSLTTWRKATLGYALRTDGTLWKLGATLTQVAGTWLDVGASGEHQGAVSSDGTVWMWGSNSHGQLGLGDYVDRSSPTQISRVTTGRFINCASKVTVVMAIEGGA